MKKKQLTALFEVKFKPELMGNPEEGGFQNMKSLVKFLYMAEGMGIFENEIKFVGIKETEKNGQ